MFKIVKKTFTSTAEGYTYISKNVNVYGTTTVVSIDEKATDLLCSNLVSFLNDCGRKDVRYDEETKYTWIFGVPCLIYALANNSVYKAIGIRFPYGFGYTVSQNPTVTPTGTTTTAHTPCGAFVQNGNSFTMSFKFVGTENGAFVLAFGTHWRRYRATTSTTTWNIGPYEKPMFNVGKDAYIAFCKGKNIITGNKAVCFNYCGMITCYGVEIKEDGTIDASSLIKNGIWTNFSVNIGVELERSDEFSNYLENGKVPFINIRNTNTSSPCTYIPCCYSYIKESDIPECVSIYEDSATIFSVGDRTFWVARVNTLVTPGTNNAYLKYCYNPFFPIVDITEDYNFSESQ